MWARNEDEEIDWGHVVEDVQCQDKEFAFISVGGREQLTVQEAGISHASVNNFPARLLSLLYR